MQPYLLFLGNLLISSAAAAESPLTICVNYHCEQQLEIQLTPDEWQAVLSPFAEPANDARTERTQVSRAIALFEKVVGPHARTNTDKARNDGDGDQIGQLDCIAESKNTKHYLNWLDRKGKLRWHSVENRISRSPLLFDVHWSAVIKQHTNNKSYVVDSWFYANGEVPVIQPVDQWLEKRSFSNQVIP
ncbi:MAG: hypothetical protein EP297_12585 [Gammaproteobacteria bacterium]|nr:MAG: hypothetical protein EP297_12585 [Gammaproteobacteria bacterium]